MLDGVGLTPDQLFEDVPDRFRRQLDLPSGQSDIEVEDSVRSELSRNVTMTERPALLGGGSYAHWIPPETRYLATRGEFLTSYTPYQSEINQGLLTALFEFQTLSARLLELEVANTGVYDGASGAGEACLMALRAARRADTVLVPDHLPTQRRSIIHNYIVGAGGQLVTVPTDEASGTVDLSALEDTLSSTDRVAAVHVETPNVFGCFEPMAEIGHLADEHDVLFTALVPEVTSLGLVHGPGHHGVDIAAAEGQPMALPPSFGGPALGLFGATERLLRKMPGRIAGQTEDADGQKAYCLTLQTREQHIRRSRATSNICTNQSLLSVLFTTSLATMGEAGFQRLARTNAAKARGLRERLAEAGAEVPYLETPSYNEVLFQVDDQAAVVDACRQAHVDPGLPADRLLGDGQEGLIACVTELTPDWAIDAVVSAVEEVQGR